VLIITINFKGQFRGTSTIHLQKTIPFFCVAIFLCPAHLYGFVGLLIVDVEQPQNGLYPRDVYSRCGYSNSEVTVEQYILTCVVPESM